VLSIIVGMKKLIVAFLLVLVIQTVGAQIRAVTDTGEEVVLYADGKWKYVKDSIALNNKIATNKKLFIKDPNAGFLVKSKKFNIGVWIDPKIWSFNKMDADEASEYRFQKKGGGEEIYAMLISEKVSLPMESIAKVALINAKKVSPDVQIVKNEYRTVNGKKLICMQMAGTIEGIKFRYFGYYYSNTNGTIQLLTYTFENLFESHANEMEAFLNGLVEID
jgi:hypothetical protein